MIKETVNSQRLPSLTSDQWHVILARWSGKSKAEPRFTRTVVSEHESRIAAVKAARGLRSQLAPKMKGRTALARDQVLVRKPHFKTLANAKRIVRPKA